MLEGRWNLRTGSDAEVNHCTPLAKTHACPRCKNTVPPLPKTESLPMANWTHAGTSGRLPRHFVDQLLK